MSTVLAWSTLVLASSAHGQLRPGVHPPNHPGATPAAGDSLGSPPVPAPSPGSTRGDSILPQSREPGRPAVTFHSESTTITVGQSAEISLAVDNITDGSEIDVRVVLSAPPGLLLSGASCTSSGQCSDDFALRGGENQALTAAMTGNQADIYTLTATIAWTYCCFIGNVRGPFEMHEPSSWKCLTLPERRPENLGLACTRSEPRCPWGRRWLWTLRLRIQ